MDWLTLFVERSKTLPLAAQASVLLALTWAGARAEEEGELLAIPNVEARIATHERFEEGLGLAVAAGWLEAPTREGGEMHTLLRTPPQATA